VRLVPGILSHTKRSCRASGRFGMEVWSLDCHAAAETDIISLCTAAAPLLLNHMPVCAHIPHVDCTFN
jgi:hypothetical protein